MAKRTNHVIVVGAGLGGLASALHLRAAGYEVTILERRCGPGGRYGALEIDGYRFDTGPAYDVRPDELAAPLDAVGERLDDWIELAPADPLCRAHYPDGTTIDVRGGAHEARAHLRLRRLFGYSPLGGPWVARGGGGGIARMLAAVSEKHGIFIGYGMRLRRWATRGGRVASVMLGDEGESMPVDAVVLPRRTIGRGPSCLVLHLGAEASFGGAGRRNVHLGRAWQRSRHELLVRGELMRDPTIAVNVEPGPGPGRHVYQVVVPVPDLRMAPMDWDGIAARKYAGEVMATLEARGYLDLGMSVRVSYVVTPADWARQGMAHGIPFGDSSHSRRHPALANVVYSGSGLQGGRRAAHWIMETGTQS